MSPSPNPTAATSRPVVLPYVYPLDKFYARAGLPLPKLQLLAGQDVPEPYQSLLVHTNDMTPTLEAFHRSDIHLEILRSEQREDFYLREVVLRLDRDEQPVEFGANKINLGLFVPEVRQLILKERLPLGHILKVFQVPHATAAKCFLSVEADDLINRAFGLLGRHTLFGRQARIVDLQQRPLSEIVEILPPLP